MKAYYNEIDPHAAQWLRNLIAADIIPAGDVDERSIEDVIPNELRGYTQCHFFAGAGGWAYALDLAGWPCDRPVWTGSCPCQPFSAAGKGAGLGDERHLWPAWQHLIAQCRPAIVFGEQVSSKAADAWTDLVHSDMEGMGYAFGCIPFPAAGVGALHGRERNYWVARHAAYAERDEQSRQESRGRSVGRVGRVQQPVSWDEPWPSALSRFRVMGYVKGSTPDGRTNLWHVTCGCGAKFTPTSTMYAQQVFDCPRCGHRFRADWNVPRVESAE